MAFKELGVGEDPEGETSGDFALPVPTEESLSVIQEGLFEEVRQGIEDDPDPMFNQLEWGDAPAATGSGGAATALPTGNFKELEPPPPAGPPPVQEEEKGFLNNTARLIGQRGVELTGSIVRAAGEMGESLEKKVGLGSFVWGDGDGLRYVSREDLDELKKQGVSENLLTETIPMALQDRDLGGEKRHTSDNIKEAWAAGDAGGVASATAGFIAETGLESLPDMLAAVYILPLYIAGRSEELAEERVRNERLSEVLATDVATQAQINDAAGYVTAEEVEGEQIATAAPFAALSALLERIGAKGIAGAGSEISRQVAGEAAEAGMRAVLKEGGRAAGKEAGTEAFQEGVLEYVAEKYGTSTEGLTANMSLGEATERGAFAALAGGGFGGAAGTTVAAGRSLMTSIPETDIDPDTGKPVIRKDDGGEGGPPPDVSPDVEAEASSYEVVDGNSAAENAALEETLDKQAAPLTEQGTLDLPETSAPAAPETATTPTTEAPVVTPAAEPAAAETAAVEPTAVKSPMIDRKTLQAQLGELNKRTKGGVPGIRQSIKKLGAAINKFYPDAKLPSLKGTIGAKRVADYFATLDEQIDTSAVLPNLKGFLEEVVNSPDAATAAQNFDRLTDYVTSNMPAIETAGSPFLEQANQGVSQFDTFEARRLEKAKTVTTVSKKTGKKTTSQRVGGKLNRLARRAVAVDELATTVSSLVKKATDMGIEVAGDVNETVRRARSYRASSEVAKPRVLKGGAGAMTTPQTFRGKNLDEVGGKLREAATTLSQQIAKGESKTGDTKAKAAPKKSVTEPVTKPKAKTEAKKAPKPKVKPKPKKAEAAKKTSKKKTTAKKKGVKGAAPKDVLEVKVTPTTGKQSQSLVAELGFGSDVALDTALKESGVSKKAFNTVKSILNTVGKKAQGKILSAIRDYDGNNLKFYAQVEEAIGKPLAPNDAMELFEYVEKMAVKRDGTYEEQVQRDQEVFAEAEGQSVEDFNEIQEMLGYDTSSVLDETYEEGEMGYGMDEETFKSLKFSILDQKLNNVDDAHTITDAFIDKLISALVPFRNSEGFPKPPTSVNDVLDMFLDALPSNHRFYHLAKQLRALDMQVPIHMYDKGIDAEGGGRIMGMYHPGEEIDGSDAKISVAWDVNESSRDTTRRIFHEVIHAATNHAYETNDEFAAKIDHLYKDTVDYMKSKDPNYEYDSSIVKGKKLNTFYGMEDSIEFIAEAMTNHEFQAYLARIPTTLKNGRISNMLQEFKNAVKKLLGYSVRNNVLDAVIDLVGDNMLTQAENETARQKMAVLKRRKAENAASKEDSPAVQARNTLLDAERRLPTGVREAVKRGINALKLGARKGDLGFSNRDVIERNFRALFDKAASAMNIANPLTAYTKAKNSSSARATQFERKAYKLLIRQQKIDNKAKTKLGEMERDITLAQVWAWKSLKDKANAHLWTKPNKKTGKSSLRPSIANKVKKARNDWIKFNKAHPEAARLLMDKAALTQEIREAKLQAAGTALGESFDFDIATVKAMAKARTAADVDSIFPDDEVKTIEDEINDPTGQLFEDAGKDRKSLLKKKLAEAEARVAAAKSLKQILNKGTLPGPYFPLRRYGNFVVSSPSDTPSKDRYVSFHSSQAEAEAVAKKLNAQGDEVSVTTKIHENAIAKDVTAVATAITRRIKDPETLNRVRGAIAEVLGESAAYASQLKRHGVDGVAADDMGRAFEEYVSVAKHAIGDLEQAHNISTALKQMISLQKGDSGNLSTDELVRLGQAVTEIAKQNREEANDRTQSTFQKVVGLIGFANFLGAPSYWALNATQTYTVTMPYVAAKWGFKGPTQLLKAQGVITAAVGRAITSKDKSYEGFKKQLPPAAQKVVEELERQNIIQSTIAHEFGDILSPSYMNKMLKAMPPVGKTANLAMQIMEKVPEAIEHYNRISTALAAYELSGGDMIAVADAVQETQFNYDTGNRARLLKAFPGQLGGGGRPLVTPVMMFKTYGVGMARLLYKSMFDAMFTQGKRAEAAKLAAGLITSHTLFAGVAGGLMAAPVQAIVWAINAAFKEVDDEWDPEEGAEAWAAEHMGDTAATMVRRGIPAALGVDMSQSINLGNLIWMGNERLDPTQYGAAEQIAFKAFGPVAQYGVNAYREGARLVTGETSGGMAEFLEAAIPLKAYRGVSQAVRYSGEGIETNSGLSLVDPFVFSSALTSALGFQPTAKTEPTQKYYADQLRDQRRSHRKSELTKKILTRLEDGENFDDLLEEALSYNMSVPAAEHRISSGDMARLRSRQRSGQRDYDKEYRYGQ